MRRIITRLYIHHRAHLSERPGQAKSSRLYAAGEPVLRASAERFRNSHGIRPAQQDFESTRRKGRAARHSSRHRLAVDPTPEATHSDYTLYRFIHCKQFSCTRVISLAYSEFIDLQQKAQRVALSSGLPAVARQPQGDAVSNDHLLQCNIPSEFLFVFAESRREQAHAWVWRTGERGRALYRGMISFGI